MIQPHLFFIVALLIMMTPTTQSQPSRELFNSYDVNKLSQITSRRFTNADMLSWLKPLQDSNVFSVTPLGTSGEGRSIQLLTVGSGKTKVLLWSQMHGDESTATMALLDILNYFRQNPRDPFVKAITEKLTLLIIPMLNPDGAERFTRRTAHQIDLNRDALALQTPEARILKETRDKFKPEFGFNLHDKEPHYSVGTTRKITAIALLAPPADELKKDAPVRVRAKHVAAVLAKTFSEFIPKNLAKWDDTFEPRAFGDNIQRWGTSTVLIESGGWPDDKDKMFLRKLNYVGILTALNAIADGSYKRSDLKLYERIPFNTRNGYDFIIRNVQFRSTGKIESVLVDVGINFEDQLDAGGRIRAMGKIVDIGDLSTFASLKEIDAERTELDSSIIGLEKSISPVEIRTLFPER
jgi:hypothetical protein